MRMIEEASRANRAGGRQKKSCIRKYEMRHQFKFSGNEHLKLTIVYKQEREKGLPMTNLVHRKYEIAAPIQVFWERTFENNNCVQTMYR